MYLTGREIKDLAEFAGFVIDKELIDDDYFEQEFCVEDCPKLGVEDDDGVINHYQHVATCDEFDGNECMPLGDPLIK